MCKQHNSIVNSIITITVSFLKLMHSSLNKLVGYYNVKHFFLETEVNQKLTVSKIVWNECVL